MIIRWTVDPEIRESAARMLSLLQLAADRSLQEEGISRRCGIAVRLCDDDAIAAINAQYRGIDRSTDILSFPTVSYPAGRTARDCQALLAQEYDDDLDAVFLGDLILSVPHTLAQAEEFGHSVAREAAYLLVHGICHLLGYDHIESDERGRMRAMEERILSSLNLSREPGRIIEDDTLMMLAREAMMRSYSPYSHFPVGAALLAGDGRIFQGCNIENASFGVTNCAERTALFKAVSEGAREFSTIAIAAHTLSWPCGVCRQALNEFAPKIRVIVGDDAGHMEEGTLDGLLPNSFGPDDLNIQE